jgi:ComF family protein
MPLWGIHKPPKKLIFYHYFWRVLDTIFPPHCAGCSTLGERWCTDCASGIRKINTNTCPYCKRPAENKHQCDGIKSLDFLRAFALYAPPFSTAVQQLKYKRNIGMAEILAFYLLELYNTFKIEVDMVIPIPLSEKRHKSRGYNQVSLLARPFSLAIRRPIYNQALTRIRDTRSQVGLNRQERSSNVTGAFTANPTIVAGKTILLIDDVLTTGATMEASAYALKIAGAKGIMGLTLAQAIQTSNGYSDQLINTASETNY